MHTGNDNNLIVNNPVENPVWETVKKCAAGLAMDNGKLQRICHNGFDNFVGGEEEHFAQTSLLSLLPLVGVFNIG